MDDKLKSKKSKKKDYKSKLRKRTKDKKKKKYTEKTDSDIEYEEYMRGQEEEDEEGQINIIFGIGGNGPDESEELIEDENEECDSEDEKTFMKESYQNVELPEETKKEEDAKKQKQKEKDKKKKKSAKNKTNDSEESDKFPPTESEYSLVDEETSQKSLKINLEQDPFDRSMNAKIHQKLKKDTTKKYKNQLNHYILQTKGYK